MWNTSLSITIWNNRCTVIVYHFVYYCQMLLYNSTCFSSTDDQEQEIKLLQKKRNQLAGYCKLVIFGVMDLNAATTVFKYYDKVQLIKASFTCCVKYCIQSFSKLMQRCESEVLWKGCFVGFGFCLTILSSFWLINL